MLSLLLQVLLCGLAAGGLGSLVRALSWPAAWKKRKPLACAVCLGGWSAFAVLFAVGYWPGWRDAVLLYFGTAAVGAWVVHQLFPPEIDLGAP